MLIPEIAERWLRPEVARFVSWVSLAMSVGLAILMFATNRDGQTAFGSSLGSDFGEFYVVGQILNDGASCRLFDLDDQDERLHQLLPRLSRDEHLPFVYPPFLALIFRPLAKFPFVWSFAAWLVVSVGLYAGSIALTWRSCAAIQGPDRRTGWLLALAFPPFALECCLGGQLSAIGTVTIAGSLALANSGQTFRSGLVLAILVYKPTLLVLILPMLVIARSWRILGGFFLGGLILAIVSWLMVGVPGCLDFLKLMVGYGRSGGSVGQGFKTIKYVDLTAFLRLIGIHPPLCRPIALLITLPFLMGLVIAWARTVRGRVSDLTWAATIVLTPVLNIYGPIYDVTMIVPGLLIGSNAVRVRNPVAWPWSFRELLALLSFAGLVTQPSALRLGFQPLTIGLLALGSFFLVLSLRDRSQFA